MSDFEPAYVKSFKSGQLALRVQTALQCLSSCTLCPRECRVNRLEGETGVCNTGRRAWVSSDHPHFGEEAPLVGRSGSGTIFITHCNLGCIFCQNYDISHQGTGRPVSAEQLAGMMQGLQTQGCHNINIVTPSHVVPQILEALDLAAAHGLRIPLVYNSSGYDGLETLRLLEGVVDIYMPDFKFWDPQVAQETCNAPDYPEIARQAVCAMHRQVGDLVIDPDGIARRGLLVRHLVMPRDKSGTAHIMRFLAQQISPQTYVNIMPQYRPCGQAEQVSYLASYPTREDFAQAYEAAGQAGLTRLDQRRPGIFRI